MRSVAPAVGSLFVNTYYVTDSSGHVVPDSVQNPGLADDTQIVVLSKVTVRGRKNVIALTGPAHPDTTYYSFAPNGDVWTLNTQRRGVKWERLPLGLEKGKMIKTKPKLDTGALLGRGYAFYEHTESKILGWDTLTVNGKMLHCVRMDIVQLSVADSARMAGLPNTEFGNTISYWYAPSLGYFARVRWGWGGSYFLNQQLGSYVLK